MYGSYPRWVRADDYPWALTREQHEQAMAVYEQRWGEPIGLKVFAPSMAADEGFRQRWARLWLYWDSAHLLRQLGVLPGA